MAGCAPAATVPVYLAQGGKDEQVPPEDVDALLKALQKAGNKRVQAKTYPELSHLFAPTKTGSMADYSDPDLNMSEEFLGDAVAFLSSALKK
ncbi:MAG: prolyl oligopeptidase family serine peptidase [Polyangiaceae bacterium]